MELLMMKEFNFINDVDSFLFEDFLCFVRIFKSEDDCRSIIFPKCKGINIFNTELIAIQNVQNGGQPTGVIFYRQRQNFSNLDHKTSFFQNFFCTLPLGNQKAENSELLRVCQGKCLDIQIVFLKNLANGMQ